MCQQIAFRLKLEYHLFPWVFSLLALELPASTSPQSLYFLSLSHTHSYVIVSTIGDGTPLQYSCLDNPKDGGAWWAAVHGVAESRTGLSNFIFTFHFHA